MVAREKSAKIRALVVDDESLARSNIVSLLRRDPEIEIVGECGSGAEAIQTVPRLRPDLLFLDIQMPECDGFDVLEQLSGNSPAAIVFVTAYDQYALRAFEAGALDYLLKPFDDARFCRALGRAKGRLSSQPTTSQSVERFVVKGNGQVVFVNVPDIDWIEAADYYSCLHVGPRTHLLRRSMADLEQELDHLVFCRIHRSSIVNMERVVGLKLNEDGDYDVILEDGVRLRLSRGYRKELQARLGVRALS